MDSERFRYDAARMERDGDGTAAIAGVAAGFVAPNGSATVIANTTMATVQWSHANSTARSTLSFVVVRSGSGSTVSGFGIGHAIGAPLSVINTTTMVVSQSTATTAAVTKVTSGGYAFSGSSVSGVGVGVAQAGTPVSIRQTTMVVAYSNATSLATSTSSGAQSAFAGSAVGGVGLDYVHSNPILVVGSTVMMLVTSSNATITANSSCNKGAWALSESSVRFGSAPQDTVVSRFFFQHG